MGYRRLFIMRKDLGMTAGKLAAQVAHCAEAYWTRMLADHAVSNVYGGDFYDVRLLTIDKDTFEQYINGPFVKTVCEAKNKTQLLKAAAKAEELGLQKDVDYGLIYDNCLTDLAPEEPDGTTLTGVWFKPLPDEVAHEISRKYQLWRS